MSRFFSKSSKVAAEPPPPPPPPPMVVHLHVFKNTDPLWKDFAIYVPADEEEEYSVDYTNPGPLAYELAKICSREKAYELDAEKIMYFAESTNYLLILKKENNTIGFLLLYSDPGQWATSKIWLVCVSSEFKGKQFSKVLIDHAKTIAKNDGKTEIHLEALNRELGKKVYEPQGFIFNSSRGDDMTAQLGGGRRKKTRKRRGSKQTRRRRSAFAF
jgi:ribosomal protein S18 acetylase RimI-like enzyme